MEADADGGCKEESFTKKLEFIVMYLVPTVNLTQNAVTSCIWNSSLQKWARVLIEAGDLQRYL